MDIEIVNYRGIQIKQNPLTGDWLLIFNHDEDNPFKYHAPMYGSLSEMKEVIRKASKDGLKYLVQATPETIEEDQ